jgi:DNA ligase, NAD-dependent
LSGAEAAHEADARARIEFLATEIARHDELYFRKAQPEISDADYDALKRELVGLRGRYPELAAMADGATGVGDDRVEGFRKRKHLVPMLSLEKVHSTEELSRWHGRIAGKIPRAQQALVIEPKFDGIAISATYVRGQLVQVVTRGNGEEGDDVTENALRFCRLPRLFDGSSVAAPERIEVRGEVYVAWEEFRRINRERTERGAAEFASPRNLAAGTLKLLDEDADESRALTAVFFGIGGLEIESDAAAPSSEREMMKNLRAWGLPVTELVQVAETLEAALGTIRDWERARAGWAYPVDGVVLKLDSFVARRELGEAREAPRWAVAFKFAPTRVATRLRAITFQVGRTGVLTPVAELEPVTVGGAVVARASLHNAEEIARRDLRIGDTVWVERAGEIIPAIVGVDLARRAPDAPVFQLPEKCPACATIVERRGESGALRCPNLVCPAQLKRRLRHFAAPQSVGIKGLGPATIDALVDAGAVKRIADLYALRPADIVANTRLRARSAETLVAEIAASRNAELARVLNGLGLPGIGPALARALAGRFAGFAELTSATVEELRQGNGFGATTAAELAAYLRQPDVQRELAELEQVFRSEPSSADRR